MNYRKATINDLNNIASLVTKLLGTCNINAGQINKNNDEITIANEEEIKKDISNYCVCEIDNKIVGACGISNIKSTNNYGIDIGPYREILYLVVDNNYQKQGIGTKLMELCCENINDKIIYEAWGEKDSVNSKRLLEKLGFKLLKDLGDTYYKDHNYCVSCVNRNKNCNSCKAELWFK